ncbi:MAG: serine/threonine protein kinase [Alphaproteobacteria bacterium]|nr:serine/threonine protein kinase [Alphaproteobacteria bacterium]
MAADPQIKSNTGQSVTLGGRIEIFPSMPLPELNTPGGPAYTARFRSDASSSLYAIVCQSKIPPRLDSIQSLRSLDDPGIVRLVDAGVVQWIDGTYTYALIYQKPTAPALFATLDETHPTLSEDTINRHFIAPLIQALISFDNIGFVHNSIRPTNIFWRSGTAVPPQIGESLSVPPGFGQPVLFETLERSLASPLGRGIGTHADDCYAFGVSLAFLIVGTNPVAGMGDRAIIDLKMQRGSFATIVGSHRILPTHIEILRGLLADDPLQRWTSADLDQWLNGRRMTPKSSDANRRAVRHFIFMDKEYWQIGPLVEAFVENPAEATKAVENESLNKWLLRAMNDKERAERVEDVVNDLKRNGKTAHYEEQLVARVCMALDNRSPIRYRGISAMPAGLPTLLVEAVQGGASMQPLSEMITSQLVSLWIQLQGEQRTNYIALGQLFDRVRIALEKSTFGNGVERAVYETNSALPCLSPMLAGQYVATPKMLLPALERVAAGGGKSREPMDRHIAAFLIVREKRSEKIFFAFNSPDDSTRRGLDLLTLFGELQNKYGPEELPRLAAWLSPVVEPALRRYASKPLRESLQKQAKEFVAQGRLSDLLRLIDDPRRLVHDEQDFVAARLLYLNIQKEILALEARTRNRGDVERISGKPLAVTISSLLAVIIVSAAVLKALYSALFG